MFNLSIDLTKDKILKSLILFAWLCIPALGYLGVIICEPVIWCLMCAQLMFAFFNNPYIKNSKILAT